MEDSLMNENIKIKDNPIVFLDVAIESEKGNTLYEVTIREKYVIF